MSQEEDSVCRPYDERANVLPRKDDTDMDGIVDYEEIYTYDDDGNELTRKYLYHDESFPSSRDSGWSYTYDENGNMLTAEHDEGLNGEVDWNRSFAYDEEGRLGVQDEYHPVPHDHDYDGMPDAPSHVQGRHVYDEQACLILEEVDAEADGTVESHVIYECDDHGNHTLQESYDDVLGYMIGRKRWAYDEDGNMLTEQVDPSDGSLSRTTVFTYNADGYLATEEVTSPDGIYDSRIEYAYDEYGNMLEDRIYAGEGDEVVASSKYSYECWE